MPLLPILTSLLGPLVSDLIGGHHVQRIAAAEPPKDSEFIGAVLGAGGGWGVRILLGMAIYAYISNSGVRAGVDSAIAAAVRGIGG